MSANPRLLAKPTAVTDRGYNLRPPKPECERYGLVKRGWQPKRSGENPTNKMHQFAPSHRSFLPDLSVLSVFSVVRIPRFRILREVRISGDKLPPLVKTRRFRSIAGLFLDFCFIP